MSTTEFEPYKVDHLFLLIGENPLPNYIAAQILLKEDGTVYLVHSTDTTSKAACLERMLKAVNVKPISLGRHEANSYVIKDKIQTEVKNILKKYPKHTFGLNYTGGTKAMSVHGYRALFETSGVQNPVFSYLDARSLQMFIDKDNDSPKAEAVDIKLSLKEIFDLHDLRWKTEPITDPVLPELAMKFAKLYTDKKVVISWHWWCDNVLKPGTKILKKKSNKPPEWQWKKEINSELNEIQEDLIIPLTPDIAIYNLNEELKKILIQEEGKSLLETFQKDNFLKIKGICDYCSYLWDSDHAQYIEKIGGLLRKYLDASLTDLSLKKAAEKAGFQKLKHICEWLQGNWLEHYVLQQIQEVSQANPGLIYDTGLSFKVRDKKKQEEGKDKFEFDVAFMKGYQLFALSCTTDASKSLCKSKLFEAYIRAQQLGGEQARVALVCCYDQPKELEAELKVDTEVKKEDPKIIVFGCEHLDDIQKYIKDWIDDNNRYYAP